MKVFLFILLGLGLSYFAIYLFVYFSKKKRKSSPSAVISICFDGISFLKIGDSRLKVISCMGKMGLLSPTNVSNYLHTHIPYSDDGKQECVLSEFGFLEFKEYNCIFYNNSLCGIQMKFKDTQNIGELFEEAKKNISVLNGKYEQTDDGRFIWTQKNPYRLIILNTKNKGLSVYDYHGMYPSGKHD